MRLLVSACKCYVSAGVYPVEYAINGRIRIRVFYRVAVVLRKRWRRLVNEEAVCLDSLRVAYKVSAVELKEMTGLFVLLEWACIIIPWRRRCHSVIDVQLRSFLQTLSITAGAVCVFARAVADCIFVAAPYTFHRITNHPSKVRERTINKSLHIACQIPQNDDILGNASGIQRGRCSRRTRLIIPVKCDF